MKLTTIKIGKHTHVLKERNRETRFPDANYQETGMALCGVLLPGEDLEGFAKRVKKGRMHDKDVDKVFRRKYKN